MSFDTRTFEDTCAASEQFGRIARAAVISSRLTLRSIPNVCLFFQFQPLSLSEAYCRHTRPE